MSEDLPIWKKSIELSEHIFVLTQEKTFGSYQSLQLNLETQMLTFTNKLAQSLEEADTSQRLLCLYEARGSNRALQSSLHLLERLPAFSSAASLIQTTLETSLACHELLQSMTSKLQTASFPLPHSPTFPSLR